MNDVTTIPYSWLKTIDPRILKEDHIPLLGKAPPFPWNDFSAQLAKVFELDSLSLQPGELKWITPEELGAFISEGVRPLYFSVATLEGHLCWLMPESDILTLINAVVNKKVEEAPPIMDVDFKEGFYDFIALEALFAISNLDFDSTLSPHLLKEGELGQDPCLCLDVTLSLWDGHHVAGKWLISADFSRSWQERYSQRSLTTPLSKKLGEHVQVEVSLEAGKASIPYDEWKNVSCGDFILLDQCSMDPDEEKGRVWATLKGMPCFRARIKPGQLKVLELPLYYEVNTSMERSNPEAENNDEEEMENLEEDELDFEEDEEDTEDTEEEDDEEIEDSSEEEEEEETEEETREEQEPLSSPQKREAKSLASPKDISVPLVVEVGRIQMSVQKLLELQPGNVLELDIRPESGVDLVVNGKCVGKGELLKVGEVLGVRVLDLG